jgi:DNA-binding NarL/FixJ family response regulator
MTATLTSSLKVLVVDDHRSYAEALSLAISIEPGFESIGSVPDVESAIQVVLADRPDVVVIDWQLPLIDGVEGIRRILVADPRVKLVMITGHADSSLRKLSALAGASAFLAKESSIAEIVQAVRDSVTGDAFIDVSTDANADTVSALSLTPREIEVLYLLAKGRDTPTIAAALFLSVHTVRGYVKEVLRKLGAHSQLEAVAVARRAGLLPDAS